MGASLKNGLEERLEAESRLQAKVTGLREEAAKAKCVSELDLKNKVIQLESEVEKQRQRCLTIIEEKEDEVAMLKSTMETTIEMAFRASQGSDNKKSPSPAHLAAAALITSHSHG